MGINILATETLEAISIFTCLIFLVIASIQDFKTRTVHDLTWILMGTIGIILARLRYRFMPLKEFLFMEFIAVVIPGTIVLLLVLLKLIGEAELPAFICIAAFFPQVPSIAPGKYPWLFKTLTIALPTLTNMLFLLVIVMIIIMLSNLIRLLKGEESYFSQLNLSSFQKCMLIIGGILVDIDKVKQNPFYVPLLEVKENKICLREASFKIEDIENREELLSKLDKAGFKKVWVTVAIPLMPLITIGFLLSLFFDILLVAVELLRRIMMVV